MEVKLWGTRGSLPSAGPETVRYGGNTSCVEVRPKGGSVLVLDAGSGLRRLGEEINGTERIDLLISHLHLDHIMGLGFFAPLFDPEAEVHIWGPSSTMLDLRARLNRYLNPPLFPVRLPDLPANVVLHDCPLSTFEVPGAEVAADLVCHPAPSVGYRITDSEGTLVYLPDHEPALGCPDYPLPRDWTSGADLAADADLLVHDAQYLPDEYAERVGWGHSTVEHAVLFAELVGAKHLLGFHHDPNRTDDELDKVWDVDLWPRRPGVEVTTAQEGVVLHVGAYERDVHSRR